MTPATIVESIEPEKESHQLSSAAELEKKLEVLQIPIPNFVFPSFHFNLSSIHFCSAMTIRQFLQCDDKPIVEDVEDDEDDEDNDEDDDEEGKENGALGLGWLIFSSFSSTTFFFIISIVISFLGAPVQLAKTWGLLIIFDIEVSSSNLVMN